MARKLLAVLGLVLGIAQVAGAAPRIERVEPASWWVGMKDDRLQLLVHGSNVAALEPAIDRAGVTVTGVDRVANPNYLFVNLRISPEASPGRFPIEFRERGRTRARYDYTLQAREPGSAQRRGFGPGDVIYLVTPDRFANGDPSNDASRETVERPDRTQPFGRHGGDLAGVIAHLDYVRDMGFTQLWLTPVLENDQPKMSYHGYAITDFYKVDPRFGSNDQYRRLAGEARKRGVGLVMDMVLNHCGSAHWWSQDMPTPDWFNHDGHFVPTTHVREALQDIHGSEADRRAFADGWFVESMPDMNQRNPFLATYLIQNSLWWVEYAGLSGIRVDTYPYSDRDFLAAWSKRLTEEYPNLNIVGEEWSDNPGVVSYWQRGVRTHDGYVSYLPSLFDFPLQDALVKGLQEREDWGSGLRRIYRVLAADKVYADPYNLVVFHDNHDVTRMLSALGERQDLNRIALTITLTTRGIPELFYGTEVLMNSPGEKNDGIIRSDFPGGWPGDRKNAFTGAGLTDAERDTQAWVRKLLQWRRNSPAIRDGKLTQFVPLDGIYVYFRQDAQQIVMVVVNNGDASKTVETARFREVLGTATTATDVLTSQVAKLADGLVAPARSATIYEIGGGGPAAVKLEGPGITGTVWRYASLESRHVQPRNVDVWLPPGYDTSGSTRYPVVYMHDGQNLFDPATSYGHIDWTVDETMTRLITDGKVRPAIVVGVWSTDKRLQEYMPRRAVGDANPVRFNVPGIDDIQPGDIASDGYLAFLVEELKPMIDSRYRTLTGRADTVIMGSSMGGLISEYAMSRYPDVFGGAGCVSTHWPAGDGVALEDFTKHLPEPATHRYWFDHGTATLDASYAPYQSKADEAMRRAGYVEGTNWITRTFPGAEHSEKAWRLRVDQPLVFLLGR